MMTPASVVTAARRHYNALNDTSFFTDTLLYEYLYKRELELVLESKCIEDIKVSTTVTGTSQYTVPTNTMLIKRVTYDGEKLEPIDFRDDDVLTLNNADTTETGTPRYYVFYEDKIELRPTPDAAGTLDWRVFKEPEIQDATSAFETPTRYHMDLVDGVIADMYAKDENTGMADRYELKWMRHVREAKRGEKQRKRGDSFAIVKNDEDGIISRVGMYGIY